MNLRRTGIAVLSLAVGVAVLLLLAHAPFARRAALRYAVEASEQQYGLRLQASRLDYNLAALQMGLADVRLAAPHTPTEPFFEADYLSVTLPFGSLFGELAFKDISVTNALVFVRRQADGTTNLPRASDRAREEPPPLRIDRLNIPQLAIQLSDALTKSSLDVPFLGLLLGSDEGRISLGVPATLNAGERVTRLSELNGTVTFDGRALHFIDTRVALDEGAVVLDGSLRLITNEPFVDLRIKGTADIARLARWGTGPEGDVPQGETGIEAEIEGELSDPRADIRVDAPQVLWRGLLAKDVSGNARVTAAGVELDALRLALGDGSVNANALIPFEGAVARLSASWDGIDAAPALRAFVNDASALAPNGSMSGKLDFAGEFEDDMTWSGRVRIDMAPGGNAPRRISVGGGASIEFDGGTWRVDGRQVIAGVAPTTIAATGRLGDPPTILRGTVHVEPTDVPALIAALQTTGFVDAGVDGLTRGAIEGDIRLSGAVANPTVEGEVEVRNAAGPQFDINAIEAAFSGSPLQPRIEYTIHAPEAVVMGQGLRDVRAEGRMTDMALVMEALMARQSEGPGSVRGSGTYNLDTMRFEATVDGTEWELTPTVDLPAAGRADVVFSGSGTLDSPLGTGQVTVRDASWQDVRLGDVDVTVKLDGQAAQIDARAPEYASTATARVQMSSPYAAVIDGRTTSVDLARVLRGVETPTAIAGTATLAFHMEGPLSTWRTGSASLDVESLDATAGELPIRITPPARARYAGARLYVDRLEARAGETTISVSGDVAVFDTNPEPGTQNSDSAPDSSGLVMVVTGDVGEVARATAAAGFSQIPITGGDGPVALLARLTGSLETPVLAADVEVGPGSIALQDLPPISGLRVRAHAGDGWVEVREALASYQEADLTLTGRAPISLLTGNGDANGAGAELKARATNLTPAILSPFLDPTTIEQISGSVDATLEGSSPTLDVKDVTGELRIDRLDVRIADLPVTQRVPTRIVARDGFARVEAWDWTGQGAALTVLGQVRLSDRQTAILANGVVDLRLLTPWVRDAGMTTAGQLTPRLSITGTIDNPRVDGDLTVTGGEIRLADPRVIVSDLAMRSVLTRTSARITSLTGTVNGGALTGGGAVDYAPEQGLHAELSTDIRGMAFEFPEGLRSEVNGSLSLALDSAASGRVSGTVTVVRGTYREPLAVVTGLLESMRAGSLAAASASSAESARLLEMLTLDVRLLTDEDIIVNNNYGRFQLGADVRLIGTAAAPALAGRAELREGGQLFVGRNIYTINFGNIDFVNPVAIEPTLNIEAATRVGSEDIEVTITGTAESPSVSLRSSSSPDLGQAEVASLLLTGRRLEELAPGDAAFVGTQVLGNFSAEVLGFASRAVGLDTLRLGGVDTETRRQDLTTVATELDPTTRLTFGKSLGSDVELTFSQSLRDGDAQTWIVGYLPRRGLELRLVSNDSDLRSYGFRHDVAFGRAAPTVRSADVAAARKETRVAAVEITGDPRIPEARLRRALRLEPGDRFDFVDWQEDWDRLEALLRQEGFLAGRVAATRVDGPDGVTLRYQVAPGLETRIAVEGMEVTPALRARLETAWSQSVFDDFLVDEVDELVRGELATKGFLRAKVEVQFRDDDRTRTLAITVDPGPRVRATDVRIEGVDEDVAARVMAHLEARRLMTAAASDPGGVEREITSYLRANGYLRVRVTVGAPLFQDEVAVLPVTVEAGPVFTIGRIVFEGGERLAAVAGASAPGEDALRKAVALSEGMPYDPSAIDAARDRLVALARREGFALASVGVRPDIRDDTPGVDVVFSVAEGPQQVVGEVIVTGTRAIDPDVIVRAVGLDEGAAMRTDDLLQARARIFETGLFRRVDVSSEAMAAGSREGVVPLRLRVTVEEWPAVRLRYGFQVAEERPEDKIEGRDLVPGLSADLTRRTLFGRAIAVGAAVEVQRRERLARTFLNTPTLFRLPLESSLIAQRSHEEFSAVSLVTDRSSLTWEQRARFLRHLSVSYAYTFERNHTFDTRPTDDGGLAFDITINIARLTAATAWDTRNDPVDTISGSLASYSLEHAPESIGSDIRFVRHVVQAYHFRPWRRLVFASAARAGAVVPMGGQELIPSERFFAGGSRTVRGVLEDGLGERDVFGDPAGGRLLLVFNQEVRLPIYRWVRGVGFVDAGNIFTRPGDAELGNLVRSVGVGLRLATPFALLRADYAKAFWGTANASGQWTFGIGHAF